MKDLLLESAAAKVLGAAALVAPIAASTPLSQITTPILGASLTTLVSALIGSACAFAIKGEPNRYKLFAWVFVYAVLGCALVTVAPWYFNRTVPLPVQGPLAILLAFAARFIGPVATEYGPIWVRNFASKFAPPPKGE